MRVGVRRCRASPRDEVRILVAGIASADLGVPPRSCVVGISTSSRSESLALMTRSAPSSPMPDPQARDALELAWLERVRSDDAEAFEALFRAYVEPLCAFAYSYVQSQAAAQEIVQDLFCRLWERRRALGLPRSVHAYFYGAVRNRAINYLRSRRVEDAFKVHAMRRGDERQRQPSPSAEQEQALEAAGLAEALERARAAMPPRCREVFALTRDQGLTYAEAATVLRISPKTVEIHMGRALAFLREKLAPWLRS